MQPEQATVEWQCSGPEASMLVVRGRCLTGTRPVRNLCTGGVFSHSAGTARTQRQLLW